MPRMASVLRGGDAAFLVGSLLFASVGWLAQPQRSRFDHTIED
jgi:hypothetical protein